MLHLINPIFSTTHRLKNQLLQKLLIFAFCQHFSFGLELIGHYEIQADSNFIPNILTFGIKGVRGEVLVHGFEAHNIYISTTTKQPTITIASPIKDASGKIVGVLGADISLQTIWDITENKIGRAHV